MPVTLMVDLHVVRSSVGIGIDDFDPLVHRRPRRHRFHVGERLHDYFRRRINDNFATKLVWPLLPN